MITIIGIVGAAVVILDGWSNKWAICISIGTLFTNTYKKIVGKL